MTKSEPQINLDLFEARLRRMGRIGWNTRRVTQLAATLRVSIYQLCAMAGMFERWQVTDCTLRDQWPDPVCLHFSNFEDAHAVKAGQTIPNPLDRLRAGMG